MSNETAVTQTTNIVPVQGIFMPEPTFALISLIGPAGTPFYAAINPLQSNLTITNSTIDSSVIGGITPAAGNFTTATVSTQPVGATDVVNLLALQAYAAGISWKQPCVAATLTNIT
jgi:DNA-binding beta-propeller fold protein YncE